MVNRSPLWQNAFGFLAVTMFLCTLLALLALFSPWPTRRIAGHPASGTADKLGAAMSFAALSWFGALCYADLRRRPLLTTGKLIAGLAALALLCQTVIAHVAPDNMPSAVCFAFAATIAVLSFAFRRHSDNRSVSTARCPICDYDLTLNVSGRCPECGTTIDPARPIQNTAPVSNEVERPSHASGTRPTTPGS